MVARLAKWEKIGNSSYVVHKCSFGGPGAEYLKKALDSIFLVENKDTGVK